MKSSGVRVDVGIQCNKCGQLTDKMEHKPGWTPKPGKVFLSYWYVCKATSCPTTQINPLAARVLPEPIQQSLGDRLKALYDQLHTETGMSKDDFAARYRQYGIGCLEVDVRLLERNEVSTLPISNAADPNPPW
jgi:hypothetical protein